MSDDDNILPLAGRISTEEPSAAVELPEGMDPEAPPPVGAKVLPLDACRHWRVMVDTRDRELECKDCGKLVDPIEWIDQLRTQWERIYWHTTHARDEKKRLYHQIEELKREKKNLQSAVRRLKKL